MKKGQNLASGAWFLKIAREEAGPDVQREENKWRGSLAKLSVGDLYLHTKHAVSRKPLFVKLDLM